MTDATTSALLASAARKIAAKTRLSEAEFLAVDASALPPADKKNILEAAVSFTIAAAKTGGRLTDFDRRLIAERAPDVAAELRERDAAVKHRHLEAQRGAHRRYRSAERNVEIPAPLNPRRRARALKDPEFFLKTYFPMEFPRPFDPNMKETIRLAKMTLEAGGRFVVIQPRGSGKTSVLTRLGLWGALAGLREFLAILASTEPNAARILQTLQVDLTANEILREDFPEVCAPFAAGEGQALKLRGLHVDGEPLHCAAGRDRLVFPLLQRPGSAADGQVILCRGLTGALRGLSHARPDGRTVRPSCVLVDDPQSDQSARSQEQTREREQLLSGAVLGMAGPRQNISALVAATVIRKNDLAERLLDPEQHPEYEARRFQLVEKWPDAADLWEQYAATWQADGPKVATEFYKSNREKMDAGAVVPCTWRVRPGEVSAIQTAHNLRLEMGEEAFNAEMQGLPPSLSSGTYELTPAMILTHAVDIPRLHLPPAATIFTGFIDVNRRGLHWALTAFDQQMSAHVLGYGRHPGTGDLWRENAPQREKELAIFGGLKSLCDQIAGTVFLQNGKKVFPGIVLADGGFEGATVHRFVDNAPRYPFRLFAAFGKAANKYRVNPSKLIGQAFDNCHLTKTQDETSRYVASNVDFWREVMQRAFLGNPGEPGGCTLHRVDHPKAHLPFAEHIVAEVLTNKYETDGGPRWEWNPRPGSHWDWGDALTGCYTAAALSGLSSGGTPTAPRAVRHRPKPRISWAKVGHSPSQGFLS